VGLSPLQPKPWLIGRARDRYHRSTPISIALPMPTDTAFKKCRKIHRKRGWGISSAEESESDSDTEADRDKWQHVLPSQELLGSGPKTTIGLSFAVKWPRRREEPWVCCAWTRLLCFRLQKSRQRRHSRYRSPAPSPLFIPHQPSPILHSSSYPINHQPFFLRSRHSLSTIRRPSRLSIFPSPDLAQNRLETGISCVLCWNFICII
jgi:hypothetical protein